MSLGFSSFRVVASDWPSVVVVEIVVLCDCLTREDASRVVGTIPQLGDGGLHPQPGLGPDVGVIVQYPRHGLVRDAGQPGDVGHRRVANELNHVRPLLSGASGQAEHHCSPHLSHL